MLARVRLEHEVDQRAFELRSESPIDRKAGARDLRGTIEIQNAKSGPEIPVGFWFKVEAAGLAAGPHRNVVLSRPAPWDRFVRKIGNPGKFFTVLPVNLFHLSGELGGTITHLPRTLLQFRGVDALFAKSGNLARKGILFGAQLFSPRDGGATGLVELSKLFERQSKTTRGQTLRNSVE